MYNNEIKADDYCCLQELLREEALEEALEEANWAFIEAFEIKE